MDAPDALVEVVLDCANRAAGTSLTLPDGGDLPFEAFQLDSISLFVFLLELESKCGKKFDEAILAHEDFRSIRSAAELLRRAEPVD
jgi:hypothetical protein